MIKLNSKKIQTFSLMALILFLAAALISSLFLINKLKNGNSGDNCKISPLENKLDFEGAMKPGVIGEIKNNNEADDATENKNELLPSVISSTSGIITDIKNDRLIVSGDGYNFSDNKPRELNVLFSDSTIVFMSKDQKIKYQGMGGLQNLKAGDSILIEGAENIRGKTEFTAGIINVLRQ